MGRVRASIVFNQLKEAYLIASNHSEAAKVFAEDMKKEHEYALTDYYFAKAEKPNLKKALKNDVKGLQS